MADTPMEGKLIHNPTTGEVAIWDGQTAQPLPGKLVTNEQTGQKALWDGKTLTPVNVNIDQNQPTAQADQALVNKIPGATTPAQPESLMQRILRYGQTGANIVKEGALPTAGGVLGGIGGLATPVPGGALMGEMAGSAAGEYLNQKLGITEPSGLQIGLAGAAPLAGRAVGATLKALPITRSGALKQVAKVLPAESSAALFQKAGTQALSETEALPVAQVILDKAKVLAPHSETLTNIFDRITAKGGLSLKEGEAIKGELQGLVQHHSRLGTEAYNPTMAKAATELKDAFVNAIDQANPGYKAALEAYGREQNVKRLTALITTPGETPPAERLGQLLAKPVSDLRGPNKMLVQGFEPAELKEIQGLLEKLPPKLGIKTLIEGRIVGGAVGGAVGYNEGGYGGASAGIIAGMLAAPTGRRMLSELVKSGSIRNPAAVQATAQLFRAMTSRIPRGKSSEPISLE